MLELILFYLFSAILLACGVGVVTVHNTVYAALLLILAFFTSAALWILLQAEFLGLVLILVYVGAVMVLFLFVIMMLEISQALSKEKFARYMPVGLLVLGAIVVEMVLVYQSEGFKIAPKVSQTPLPTDEAGQAILFESMSNTEQLGTVLYSEFIYPLEITAIILLVAMIAAIMLTLSKQKDTKRQNIEKQVQTQRDDRIRLVDMEVEKQ